MYLRNRMFMYAGVKIFHRRSILNVHWNYFKSVTFLSRACVHVRVCIHLCRYIIGIQKLTGSYSFILSHILFHLDENT